MSPSRISLDQIRSLPDLIPTDNFYLMLGSVAGGGSAQNLALKCTHCTLPGVSNDSFEVKMFGHSVTQRGQRLSPHILQAGFLEDQTFDSMSVLYNYFDAVVNLQTGDSIGNKGLYENNGIYLYVYDQTGTVSANYQFIGMYIKEISDSELTGESTNIMRHNAIFNYDYFIPSFSNDSILSVVESFGIDLNPLDQVNQTLNQISGLGAQLNNTGNIANSLLSSNTFSSSGISPASIISGFGF